MPAPFKPTKKQLAAARGKTIPDVIRPRLKLLFVGINPSLYSAAVGHHFARPGNRFYPALHEAGITERRLSPFDDRQLLERSCGITNIVGRATARAEELTDDELAEGLRQLAAKVRRFRPRCLGFLGVTAYRSALGKKQAEVGPQSEPLGGRPVYLLPNPSGLNAHYQLPDFARLFRALWRWAGKQA